MAKKHSKKVKKVKKMKKTKRKVVKKAKAKKAKKKVVRKAGKVLRRRSGQATTTKKTAPKVLGKVVHYYDRLGVGIVELKAPLSVGDHVTFRRGDHEFSQAVSSMQIDHADVAKAKKGDVIGVKVKKEVKDGAVVLAG